MKGNKKLIDMLNSLLSDELTAINQYMVHAEMAENWGYEKFGKFVQGRAITEMKHAEKLIGRILFLEGVPVVNKLGAIHIGADLLRQLQNDKAAEYGAVEKYNKAVALASDVADNATREMLEGILKDEDQHVDEIEERLDQVDQMGMPQFLTNQV